MSYHFTTWWFDYSEIKKNMHEFVNKEKENHILEIGSFEGASSMHFADNYLKVGNSTLTCVDPWDLSDSTTPVQSETEKIFYNNLALCKNKDKVTVEKMFSTDFFMECMKLAKMPQYDFIYVDGSHVPSQIIIDFNFVMRVLKPGCVAWFDDYQSSAEVTATIDALYEYNKQELTIVHKGYQIAFRRR